MTPAADPLITVPERVAVAGDWAGSAGFAVRALRRAREAGAAHVIQLGDFGFGASWGARRFLRRVDEALAAHGQTLWFVDGNHEDFDHLLALPLDRSSGLRPVSERIAHLPRGFRWHWQRRTWLAFGGGVSLDRRARIPGRSWWPQEAQTAAERADVAAAGSAAVMLTHDCPAGVDIPGLTGGWEPTALAQARRHQADLREVVAAVGPDLLLHGHFHVRHDGLLPWPDGSETRVVGLADNARGRVEDNIVLVRTRDLAVGPV